MFSGHYEEWQKSRTLALEKYLNPDFFREKTVHELGCGYAYFSEYALKKGANHAFASDVRVEHLKVVEQKKIPHLTVLCVDADKPLEFQKVNVVIHFGLLYHLENADFHLDQLKNVADYLLLETEVCNSTKVDILSTHEDGFDQAFGHKGCRPSQKYVEERLTKAGFDFVCIKDKILNTAWHVYDWEPTENIPLTWRNGVRRFWICWKKDLESPLK